MKLLKELSIEELRELNENNKQFSFKVYDIAYEDSMYWQGEEFKLMGAKVFDYHDHYNSFYLTTPTNYGAKDGLSVAHKLDRDYLNEEAQGLYDKLCELKDLYDGMTYDELEEWNKKNECDLEEQADELCDKLADNITKMLRGYEDITDEQIEQTLSDIADGYSSMSDWETDGTVVYEHITKEYK